MCLYMRMIIGSSEDNKRGNLLIIIIPLGKKLKKTLGVIGKKL